MHFGEHRIGGQAVIGKHDVAFEAAIEHRAVVGGGVVIGQGPAAAGLQIIAAELCNAVDAEGAGFGHAQRFGIDVGGVDHRFFQQAFFVQQDRQRPDFFTGAAAGHPEFDRGIGAQYRHRMLAQTAEIGRVAEHLRHLHGEELHRLRKCLRLVQQAVLQVGHARAIEAAHGVAHASTQRRHRVIAEVIVIALVDRFQQYPQLQIEQLHGSHCREHHTRHSDTSLSTSMGLGM